SPNPGVQDQAAAIRMGKALFWDEQTGGDGRIACATCHFHAGADNRTVNTINPGPTASPNDDIVGSQGIVQSTFIDVNTNADAVDTCTIIGVDRRVTGRNTPTVIGATLNRQNFWDGRANDNFNGANPFGATGNAGGANIGGLVAFSSLASQSVGP